MDPAKSILDLVGIDNAASVTGKHVSRIYRWTYPTSRGGTGGIIPHADALKILGFARENNIPLSEADFLRAASIADIAEPAA